jgi:hypothetical protein
MTEYISAGESWKNTGAAVTDLGVTIPAGATALWTGSTWIVTDAPTIVNTVPPANPAEGQQWVDSSETPNILKVYHKYPTEGWVEISTTVKKGTDIGVDDGATKNNFSGPWTLGATYQKGDIVTNANGDSWSCNITHLAAAINAPPGDGSVIVTNSYWKLLAARGAKGDPSYTWIKYADDATGTNISSTPLTSSLYVGIAANKISSTASSSYSDYVWSLFKGDKGVKGDSSYMWIKYADDANGAGLSDSPTDKKFIGIATNKTTAIESTTASDYTWSPLGTKGDTGDSAVRVYRGAATNTQPGQPTGNYSAITNEGTAVDTWYKMPVAVNGTTIKMQWQCDGITTAAGVTTWGDAYLSYLKIDTLQAISTYTGNLSSISGTGERLTINEKDTIGNVTADSHEFRAYSVNGLIGSMGDIGNPDLGFEYVFQAVPGVLKDFGTAGNLSGGVITFLPTYDDEPFIADSYVSSFTGFSPFSSGNIAMLVDIGYMGNVSPTGANTANDAYGASFKQASTDNFYTDISKTVVLAYDMRNRSQGQGAGLFSYLSHLVYICDGTYSINATGKARFTYSTQSVTLCNGTDAITCLGNITTNGNVTAYDGSDRRWKHNIVKIENPLEKLSKISGYTFTWNQDYYDKQNKELFKQHDVGVIAQEIQEVLPQAVHEKEDGFLGVDYRKVIPLLIEVAKTQQDLIDTLTKRIEDLEK